MLKPKKGVSMLVIVLLLAVTVGCKSINKQASAPNTMPTSLKKTTDNTTTAKKTTSKSTAGYSTESAIQISDEIKNDNESTQYDDLLPAEGNQTEPFSYSGGPFDGLKTNPEGIDLGGKSVVISLWSPAVGDLYSRNKGKSELLDKQILRLEKAEAKFNCKIEWKGSTTALNDFMQSTMAGIKYTDILGAASSTMLPTLFVKNIPGILQPLDEIIDFDSQRWRIVQAYLHWTDSKTYALPWPNLSTLGPVITVYNPAIIEKCGVNDPFTLDKSGQWDWNAYFEVAKYCTIDFNGDGFIDQYGTGEYQLAQFLLMINGVSCVKPENGLLVSQLYAQPAMRALNYFRELAFINKVTDRANNPATQRDNFNNNKTAMYLARSYQPLAWQINLGFRSFRVCNAPKGPDVENNRFLVNNNLGMVTFPKNDSFTTEQLVSIFVYIWPNMATSYTDEADTYMDPHEAFIQSLMLQMCNTREEAEFYYETINKMDTRYNSLDYLLGLSSLNSYINTNLFTPILNGEAIGSTLEATRSTVESALKDALIK